MIRQRCLPQIEPCLGINWSRSRLLLEQISSLHLMLCNLQLLKLILCNHLDFSYAPETNDPRDLLQQLFLVLLPFCLLYRLLPWLLTCSAWRLHLKNEPHLCSVAAKQADYLSVSSPSHSCCPSCAMPEYHTNYQLHLSVHAYCTTPECFSFSLRFSLMIRLA